MKTILITLLISKILNNYYVVSQHNGNILLIKNKNYCNKLICANFIK